MGFRALVTNCHQTRFLQHARQQPRPSRRLPTVQTATFACSSEAAVASSGRPGPCGLGLTVTSLSCAPTPKATHQYKQTTYQSTSGYPDTPGCPRKHSGGSESVTLFPKPQVLGFWQLLPHTCDSSMWNALSPRSSPSLLLCRSM